MLRPRAPSLLTILLATWSLPACQAAATTAAPSATAPPTPLPSTPLSPSPPSAVPTALPPDAPSAATPPLAEQARTCPTLPTARPPDLVIGVSRHIVPIGAAIKDHRAELTESQSACQTNLAPGAASTYTCLLVTPAELDDLWREFRKRAFLAMTSHPVPGLSPHYGSLTLWLRWGGLHACEVSDSSQAKIDAWFDRDFSDLVDAVETVGRKHL